MPDTQKRGDTNDRISSRPDGAGTAGGRPAAQPGFLDGPLWIPDRLSPRGRGVNFEIKVSAIEPLLECLARARWPLYREPEERWYRSDAVEVGVRQFLVQDPDGYLLRFSARIGERPAAR
ncbi:hypothetical protein ACOTEZ_05785 [Achromobacter xylosoxidans]